MALKVRDKVKGLRAKGAKRFLPFALCHSPLSLGYNLLELMLATAVGSVIIAGTYTADVIVAKQYERISAFSEVQEVGVPSLNIIARDVRMAGYTAYDSTMTSTFGSITTPITITDAYYQNFDRIQIIYDRDTSTRNRYTYYVAQKTAATGVFPAVYGLYLNIENWNGTTWTTTTSASLVADHIDDLQFVGSDPDSNGNPRFVDIFMLFRSKSMLPANVTYTKPAQTYGNYSYTITDKYHRDDFSATINVKNLR